MSLEVHGGRSFAEACILYDKAVDALGKRVNDEDSDYDEDALEKDKKILKRELEVCRKNVGPARGPGGEGSKGKALSNIKVNTLNYDEEPTGSVSRLQGGAGCVGGHLRQVDVARIGRPWRRHCREAVLPCQAERGEERRRCLQDQAGGGQGAHLRARRRRGGAAGFMGAHSSASHVHFLCILV